MGHQYMLSDLSLTKPTTIERNAAKNLHNMDTN
jgi:hypothetical protein